MWGSSREINSKSRLDPCCVHLKHHKASNGKNLNISEQEVILSPPPLSSSCSSWPLLTFTMCRNSARCCTKCSVKTLVSEITQKKYWFICDFPQHAHTLQYYLKWGSQGMQQEKDLCAHERLKQRSQEKDISRTGHGEKLSKNVISAWFHWRLWNVNCTRVALTLKQGSWTLVLQC